MTNDITNAGRWKPGQSGNPNGRPRRKHALTDLLREKGQRLVVVGGEEKTAQEALAEAVWKLAIDGEVWLAGRRLAAENVAEWVGLVKWIFTYIEPPNTIQAEAEPELVVRVIREDREASGGEIVVPIIEQNIDEE